MLQSPSPSPGNLRPGSSQIRAGYSAGWRQPLWLALLVGASVAFSLGFACVTPFAAFAAVAALTLSRRDALLLVGAVWLANQIVGFALLDYPWTADTLAWGVVLGVAVILATVAARQVSLRAASAGAALASLAGFIAAFLVYQGVLFVVAVTLLGGMSAFTPPIVAQVFAVNAGALIGLLVLNRIAMAIGLARPAALAPRGGAIA